MIRLGNLIPLPALKEAELSPNPIVGADPNRNGISFDETDKRINARRTAKLATVNVEEELVGKQSKLDVAEPKGKLTTADFKKLRKRKPVQEDVSGAINNMESHEEEDHEGHMAKADLLSIHKKAGELYNMIGENENLEGWVQAKITKAAEYINAIHNSLQYEKTKPMSLGNGDGSPADAEMNRMDESLKLDEVAPKGWEKTVLAMKKKKEIDNPWALANWMKSKGYTPRKKKKGKKK
jgi:hypothetical protein